MPTVTAISLSSLSLLLPPREAVLSVEFVFYSSSSCLSLELISEDEPWLKRPSRHAVLYACMFDSTFALAALTFYHSVCDSELPSVPLLLVPPSCVAILSPAVPPPFVPVPVSYSFTAAILLELELPKFMQKALAAPYCRPAPLLLSEEPALSPDKEDEARPEAVVVEFGAEVPKLTMTPARFICRRGLKSSPSLS